MASDPEDQSVNPANSEVVINCVAFFYEKGKGGKLQEKKQVPLFGKARGEEAGKIQGNRLVSTIFLYLILSYLNKSTSIIDIILSFSPLKKNTDSYRTLSYMSFTERPPKRFKFFKWPAWPKDPNFDFDGVMSAMI